MVVVVSDPDPLVSVVLATNRASPYLAEALHSVAAQGYRPIEVIVVDDGSDAPESIAAAMAEVVGLVPAARLVRQEPLGVSVARNTGAAQAAGEYLVFLDDDDRWHPERIERQVEALAPVPDAPLAYCGMQSIDDSGRVVAAADQVAVATECDVARRLTGIILPNVMIRRDAFERAGGFQPALRLAEDLDLVLTLSRQGPFAFSGETLVDYRTHALNTTKRHRELCRSIEAVLRAHQQEAAGRNDRSLVRAYDQSIRANDRFAWWSALRAARSSIRSNPARAIAEVLWAISFAPWAPADAALRRLRGLRSASGAQRRQSAQP